MWWCGNIWYLWQETWYSTIFSHISLVYRIDTIRIVCGSSIQDVQNHSHKCYKWLVKAYHFTVRCHILYVPIRCNVSKPLWDQLWTSATQFIHIKITTSPCHSKSKFWPLQVAPSKLLLGLMGYVTSHLNVCCWPCGKIRDGGTCWGCPSPHQLSPWGRHVSQLSASLLSVVVFLYLLGLVVQ